MKRHGDDNFRGGKRQKRDLDGKTEIRLLIQSKSAGGVIGKGGENIKRLRTQYDANLTVPDSNSPERILTCIATLEKAIECIREVMPKLDESKNKEDEETTDVRMLVHQSHAGAIIGRAGFKIKELREQTSTNLKVYSECCPMSSDRVVQITGEPAKIMDAIKAISELIGEIPIKGPDKPYDTINYDPSGVYEYGGYQPDKNWRGGGPPPGRNWGGGGMGGGGRFGGGPNRGPPGRGYDRGPPPMDYGGGGGGYGGPRGRSGSGGDYGGFRGGGGPPPMGFGGGGTPPGGPIQTAQVTVPSELGGTIIGKNGERINRIREDSGARIVVDPPSGTSDERVITITGTQNQIQMAQYLLQQCVRSSMAGRKYIQQQQGR